MKKLFHEKPTEKYDLCVLHKFPGDKPLFVSVQLLEYDDSQLIKRQRKFISPIRNFHTTITQLCPPHIQYRFIDSFRLFVNNLCGY